MPVKTKRASPQRHCSLCWRFHWSAADLILPAILLLALCTPVRTGAAPGAHGVREALCGRLRLPGPRWAPRTGAGERRLCATPFVSHSRSKRVLFSRLHIDPAPRGPCANRGGRDGGCRACFHTVLAALGRRAGETGTAVGSLPRDTLIVSPGLSVPQQVPRAFQPVSPSTEIPLKTCSRSPCSEAVTLGATSPREQKSLCVRLQPGRLCRGRTKVCGAPTPVLRANRSGARGAAHLSALTN